MSDWETLTPKKVNDNNIKKFAGLENGYAGGKDAENPSVNIASIDVELSNKKLHPVARKALEAEKVRLMTVDTGWESLTPNSPSAAGHGKSDDSDSGWEPLTDETSTLDMAKGTGEALLNVATSLPGGLAGGFNYLSTLALTGGDTEAAMAVKHGTEETINSVAQYQPRTKSGKGMLKMFNDGMEEAIAHGGKTMQAMPGAVPLVGDGLEKSIDPNALDAIGRVVTEGALNVVDPMTMMGGARAGAKTGAKAHADRLASAEKLEALQKQAEVPAPVVEAPAADMSTMAHADDFAAINPYDVAGHVSRSEQGRPSMIDEAQGDLFGGEILQDAQPAPRVGQESIIHETIPYEKEFAFGLEEPVTAKNEMGLNLPETDSPFSLVPKDEAGVPVTPEVAPTAPAIPNIGTRDAARAKSREAQAYEDFLQQREEQWKQEQAGVYEEQARQKEADLSRIKAEEQLQFAETIAKLEARDKHRQLFLDRENFDWQEVQKQGDTSLMRQDHTIMMRNDLRKGDFNGALTRIIENHPQAAYRELATYLHSKLDGLKSKMHDEPILRLGERDVTGYYDPTTHTVGFSGRGGASPHTVLHELTHALTSRFMNERPNDIRVTGIKSLFNMLQKDTTMSKQFPGIVNPKEFVAEAFSNPKFQTFLKANRMNNRSVWGRFVDGVKSIFGLKGEDGVANAFEHAMNLGKQVVEAQATKASAMEKFKEAGMNKKLIDLMAEPPHDLPARQQHVVQNGAIRDVARKIPGLENPVSDFAFYDKPVAEIIEMAKQSVDIPDTAIETLSHQLQGGALFESLKTRNTVVKYTYERVTRAFQESALAVKRNLTDPVTGLKAYMRALAPEHKGEIHSAMMLVEGQREMTSTELANAGFSEAQIAYHNKYREVSKQFFDAINERRVALGMAPMDQRVSHIAGRFMGDFARMVYKDGKVVGRIAGNTRMELNRATKHMQKEHPEWTFEKIEYSAIGKGRQAKDRFAGMMEAVNFMAKADGDVKVLLDSYQGFLQQDAVNYLNATRHAKAKVQQAGGIIGSEGHKPWKDSVKNAEEGMKAQLAYFEQGYQWMAMEKAVNDVKKVVGDVEVVKQNPNAVEYANKYLDHAMGRNQGAISDAANWTATTLGNFTGVGHSNFFKLSDAIKHRMMQKFMGFGSIPFSVTQLIQPLQTMPALLQVLRNRGMEFSTAKAQLDAAQTYLNSLLHDQGVGRMDTFERAAVKYAEEMGIFDVKMADHTKDINQSPIMEGFDKLADANITIPEHFTRGNAFLFYSHLMREAGIPAKDIFSAAENMTNMTMVNYHPIERPMGYAKLGWLGDLASTLTRYKHNQLSQVAFYAREGVRGDHGVKSSIPLAKFLATSVAFGGVMGFYGFQEADALYELVSTHVFKKPDNLTNLVLKSELPSVISHGIFSTMGVDMTSRFSNANIVPDNVFKAMMPHGSAVWDMAESTGRLVLDPMSPTKQKQAFKSWMPMSTQGIIENELFTKKTNRGTNLYVNPTHGPNLGRGRVERSDDDMTGRAWGFRNIRESRELAQNYADGQIAKDRAELADSLITKATYAAMDGTLTKSKFAELSKRAATEYGMSPDAFAAAMVKWSIDNELSQKDQQLIRNAGRGYTGAFNIKEQRK